MLKLVRYIFGTQRGSGRPGTGGRRWRLQPVTPAALSARYDAAQTTDQDRRHWANADHLSADAAANPQVRRVLRNRARYEVANNAYAKGIVLTLANDCIGTGPRLQMLGEDSEANGVVEKAFARWAHAIDLPEKLRTLRISQLVDGESFALLTTNPRVDEPVQLDLRLIEADRVCDPSPRMVPDGRHVDGIIFDAWGNRLEYMILRRHPGDQRWRGPVLDYDRVPAEAVVHLYRVERPGQSRGVPAITPALTLFAQLRRYTLAVLGSAEQAALPGGVVYTDAPPNGEAESVEPMDAIEIDRGMWMTMPGGWKMGQVRAEQPTTTYGEFKRELINEIARCLNMPFNIAAGNSAGYNYASGRLDHQTYYKSIRVDQAHIAANVLDRIFHAWLDEAVLIEGFLPQAMRALDSDRRHQWFWDGQEHVDPAKEANAQATRLSANTTTLSREYARVGLDWEAELRQRAKEKALMRELGLTDEEAGPAVDSEREHEDEDAEQRIEHQGR